MIPLIIESLIIGSKEFPSIMILRPYRELKSDGKALVASLSYDEAYLIANSMNPTKEAKHTLETLQKRYLCDDIKKAHYNCDFIEIYDYKDGLYLTKLHRGMAKEQLINPDYLNVEDDLLEQLMESSVELPLHEAIILANSNKAPLLVQEKVLHHASFPYLVGKYQLNDEQKLEEFKYQIKNLSSEDFTD